ncbi:MAG: tRNA pseudouridine(55) synthase TruB [bacterium]
MDGVLNINKPTGLTSHEVVTTVRRMVGGSKVGHTGTLDPLATGVLLLCVGKATRIAPYLTNEEKEYVATIRLGVTTDTFDADGEVLEQREVTVSVEDVRQALRSFVGKIEQIPPMFSAVRHSGKRLYQLARAGETVEREARQVHISGIDLIDFQDNDLTVRVHCSRGTYVRSLAVDIGENLGCGAHIVALQRTRVGRFRLEQSLALEQVERLAAETVLSRHMVSMNEALVHLAEVRVGGRARRRIEHGAPVAWKDVATPVRWTSGQKTVRILGSDDTLLALGTIELVGCESSPDLRPIRVLV